MLFFVIEKVSCVLLYTTPNRQYDKRLEKLLEGEINKDLIVLGSSRGAGNILAGQIEEETGLSSYNLSYRGSNVNFHLFILETLLKYNKKPKTILLAIDNPSQFVDEKTIQFRVDVLQPYTKYNYINNALITTGAVNKMSRYFCLSRLNTKHFTFKTKKVSTVSPLDSFGGMPLLVKSKRELIYTTNIKPYRANFEIESKLKAFKQIQQLCIDHNIKLIHVFSPSFKAFNSSFYERFKTIVNPNEKIIVFDQTDPIYKDESYFYDYAHLLKIGAVHFTSEINTFLLSN